MHDDKSCKSEFGRDVFARTMPPSAHKNTRRRRVPVYCAGQGTANNGARSVSVKSRRPPTTNKGTRTAFRHGHSTAAAMILMWIHTKSPAGVGVRCESPSQVQSSAPEILQIYSFYHPKEALFCQILDNFLGVCCRNFQWMNIIYLCWIWNMQLSTR